MSKTESEIQQLIMIEAAKHGIILWRNNSGQLQNKEGRWIQFGLGNTGKIQNSSFKSSDLIGIMPYTVASAVGVGNLGLFIAIEVKREGWLFNPNDKREQAQKAFMDFIVSKGGVANFCSSVDDFLRLIGRL